MTGGYIDVTLRFLPLLKQSHGVLEASLLQLQLGAFKKKKKVDELRHRCTAKTGESHFI